MYKKDQYVQEHYKPKSHKIINTFLTSTIQSLCRCYCLWDFISPEVVSQAKLTFTLCITPDKRWIFPAANSPQNPVRTLGSDVANNQQNHPSAVQQYWRWPLTHIPWGIHLDKHGRNYFFTPHPLSAHPWWISSFGFERLRPTGNSEVEICPATDEGRVTLTCQCT